MLAEWCGMHKIGRPWPLLGAALIAANLWILPDLLFPSAQFQGRPAPQLWYGLGAALVPALLLGIFSRRAALAGGYVYIAIPAFALLILNWISWEAVSGS
jgi:hypothetical protein